MPGTFDGSTLFEHRGLTAIRGCGLWLCCCYSASGASDVAAELVRRGSRIEFNPYGYGPEDFNIPKVARAKSLLQHTEQLQHEQNVCSAWAYFRRQAEKSNFSVKCKSVSK